MSWIVDENFVLWMHYTDHSATDYNKYFFKFYSDVSYVIMSGTTQIQIKMKYPSYVALL